MPVLDGHPHVFEREWPLRVADIDRYGRLRLDAAARHVQDIGQDQLRELGFEDVHPLWIVRRTMMDVINPIEFRDPPRQRCRGTAQGSPRSWTARIRCQRSPPPRYKWSPKCASSHRTKSRAAITAGAVAQTTGSRLVDGGRAFGMFSLLSVRANDTRIDIAVPFELPCLFDLGVVVASASCTGADWLDSYG
jgi:hypothetical protein